MQQLWGHKYTQKGVQKDSYFLHLFYWCIMLIMHATYTATEVLDVFPTARKVYFSLALLIWLWFSIVTVVLRVHMMLNIVDTYYYSFVAIFFFFHLAFFIRRGRYLWKCKLNRNSVSYISLWEIAKLGFSFFWYTQL